jgi:hypothetical protein
LTQGAAQRSGASGAPRPPGAARDLRALLLLALRASSGRGAHADAARNLVLAIVFAQLLAGADHEGPPHAAKRAPRHDHPKRHRLPHRDTLSGRRPRG